MLFAQKNFFLLSGYSYHYFNWNIVIIWDIKVIEIYYFLS